MSTAESWEAVHHPGWAAAPLAEKARLAREGAGRAWGQVLGSQLAPLIARVGVPKGFLGLWGKGAGSSRSGPGLLKSLRCWEIFHFLIPELLSQATRTEGRLMGGVPVHSWRRAPGMGA